MPTRKKINRKAVLLPRFRLMAGEEIAMGPGKAELLGHIAETHSITESAARMEMSYMRAWTLVRTMNRSFREPLVVTVRGGAKRGGAELTKTGRRVLELYARLEEQTQVATKTVRRQLLGLLK